MLSAVSSSDARNIKTSIKREGDEIVINGHKWYVYKSPEFKYLGRNWAGGYRVLVIRVPKFTWSWERATRTM